MRLLMELSQIFMYLSLEYILQDSAL